MFQMKKCFCLMLTALMLASLFGCASAPAAPAATAPAQSAQNTAQPTVPAQEGASGDAGADWEQPVRQGDPIDLTILEWTTTDRPFALGEGFWADWMQEKFGDVNNIRLVYQIMDRSAETDTLNVWMASGEAPDICYTYDINIVQNYRLQDGLADLTDALAQYGGKLLEYHTAELQEFGQFDGRQMFLLGRRLYTEIVGASIRGDWLDALNLEKPATTEELYQVLTAFKTEDPGKLGDQFIGWGMYPGEMSIGYFNALYSFVDPDLTDKEFACTYPFNYPGYKDGVAFMNKLYNEGLIWSEFGLASSADLTSKIVAGNVGFVVENCLSHMNVGGNFDQMAQTVPGAYYVAVDCFTNANGNHPKLSNQPYDKFIFTPAFSDHANEAIMYLNWLCYDTPREAYSFGKVVDEAEKGSGAAYRLDNGVIVKDGNYYDQDMDSGLNFLFNGYDYGSDELNILARTVSYTNDYAETSKEAFDYAGVDSRLDPWFFSFWKITIQSEAAYAKAMQEMYMDILITCYSCPQDQFSETYDRMVGEFMELYGDEVCAEREAAWAQIHGE